MSGIQVQNRPQIKSQVQQIIRVIMEVVRYVAGNKSLVLTHDDIVKIAGKLSMDVHEVENVLRNKMITISVTDRKMFRHFIVLPFGIEISRAEKNFFETLLELATDPIHGAKFSRNPDVDIDYVVSYYFFRRENGGLMYGDPLAWMIDAIAVSYGMKPDEEIVEWEDRETNRFSKVVRYGSTRIRVKMDYTDKTIHGVPVGVGLFYEFA